MSHPMRCIRCDEPGATGGPLDGTFWRTRGNYGSEIIDDPLASGPSLEVYVCDHCLRGVADTVGYVYTVTAVSNTKLPSTYEPGIKL